LSSAQYNWETKAHGNEKSSFKLRENNAIWNLKHQYKTNCVPSNYNTSWVVCPLIQGNVILPVCSIYVPQTQDNISRQHKSSRMAYYVDIRQTVVFNKLLM
jgi:hypothetical protein